MNLTLDIGNSNIKAALFDTDGRMVCHYARPVREDAPADWPLDRIDAAIVCASGALPDLARWVPQGVTPHLLTHESPLPVRIGYETPATLGTDRIAAACGAWRLHPHKNSLIVDGGTCVTVDFIDSDGVFHGGAILPGMAMRFKALHTFTDKLPLIEYDGTAADATDPCGHSTRQSIMAGVVCGLRYEIAGFVEHYRRHYDDLQVCYTGGMPTLPATRQPYLVMIGLNEILSQKNVEL
ncbi:MAG: type III pantothenate kinase [bacterium P3]|nr:MAG: type III pantothenate kinase [bacterium P3]KWW40019.1 MAG: type III pantothenate kinase [bacterium F083]